MTVIAQSKVLEFSGVQKKLIVETLMQIAVDFADASRPVLGAVAVTRLTEDE